MDASLERPLHAPARSTSLSVSGQGRVVMLAAIMALASSLIRAPHFGDPAYHVDENFYLLVGRAILRGELPYVDIWDRKPIGLFLLYALIGLLGGSGIPQYQFVAGAFAAATAFLIALIARRAAGYLGAALAGIAYLATIEALAGGGGQAPVFYNLFIAGAALLTLRAFERPHAANFRSSGAAAMLLVGLALTMKQVAVMEGCCFGLTLLWIEWKRSRSPGSVTASAALFLSCSLAPTALGALAYYLLGHWDAYWFATVTSIFLKPPLPTPLLLVKARYLLACLMPMLLCAGAGLVLWPWRRGRGRPPEGLFIGGWLAAALAGLVIVPNFFDHYALPLAAVLAVAAAPIFARQGTGPLFWLLAVGWSLWLSHYPGPSQWGRSAALHEAAAARIRPLLRGGCLYIYDGPVDLYRSTDACRVTPYIFPEHLNYAFEAPAIGVDPVEEMQRILARRPRVIVTSDEPVVSPNRTTERLLADGLTHQYHLAARVQVLTPVRPRTLLIWALN